MKQSANTIKKTLGLYLHIPFCKTICVYCNFLTFANKEKWIGAYVEALCSEIGQKSLNFPDYIIETIYFGGGTPSLIEAELIEKILQKIKASFQLSKKVEISIECNPESINSDKINKYRKYGINRISLGVQSLNPKTLWKIARPHDEKTTLQALESLKTSKFKNFGCDLIMGLPYQTLREFKKHLEIILSYHPTHLSSYFLSYDTKRIDTFIADSPKEDEQIKMYNYLVKRLEKAGFNHYEVSNYALTGYKCQHNLRYWSQTEYLGLGLGAHSYYNHQVCENTRRFDEYLKNPLAMEEQYTLDKETQRMDLIMLSMRQSQGLNLKNYTNIYGEAASVELLKCAKKYNLTHLKVTKNNIQPTQRGFLILDKITRDLL